MSDLVNISHWPNYTLNPELAAPLIEREGFDVEEIGDPYRGTMLFARVSKLQRSELDDGVSFGDSYLDAAIFCYTASVFGGGIEDELQWDDGTPRYEPPYE